MNFQSVSVTAERAAAKDSTNAKTATTAATVQSKVRRFILKSKSVSTSKRELMRPTIAAREYTDEYPLDRDGNQVYGDGTRYH
ncbi:hypothetical protein SH528x_001082 [Novipirellula sp. SH528]|uniref:hypothetical protein n=1 Tax=Novipirellula sp. SH528 TaxID=3454466 RepID=UPI003F9EEB58